MVYGVSLFLYIGFMVGMAVADVGEVSKGGIIEPWLPAMILLITGFPALLGYLMGRDISRTCGTKSD